ncbi:hypothetical protein VNI00_009862 [Paramarasmius palmivorus]|uniref:GST N-terminal domain-containing protein n=1 Tax=Paramarasmius palmivorus TaxID=297713 RepID=A0AAW0CQW1_9AGAR
MSTFIRFFDIPSKLKPMAWSPNCWKTRYALNYKKVPYQTTWVEYPDIEKTCRDLGALPTSTKQDGSPQYTLPVIHDLATNVVVSDSTKIAAYLDTTYPDSSAPLIPSGTLALQLGFLYGFSTRLRHLFPLAIEQETRILTPQSELYFRQTREQLFGCSLEDYAKSKGNWNKFQRDLGAVDSWLGKNTFVMDSEVPTYPDLVMGAIMMWCRTVWGKESEQWKDIATWNSGRWQKLLEELKGYEMVV